MTDSLASSRHPKAPLGFSASGRARAAQGMHEPSKRENRPVPGGGFQMRSAIQDTDQCLAQTHLRG